MKDITILVTGVGSMVSSSILSSYKKVKERRIKIVGVDIKDKVSSYSLLDKYYQIGRPIEENYIENLLDICIKEKVDFLIPLVDSELIIISKNKELFLKNKIVVCLNDYKKLEIILDKGKLYNYLKELNQLKYRVINQFQYFKDNCLELGHPEKRVCFKPTISSGSRGFRIISKNDEERLESLLTERADSLLVDLEDTSKLLNLVKENRELLIMEYVDGDMFNVITLCNKGEVKYLTIAKTLDFALGNSTHFISIQDKEVEDYAKKIIKSLYLTGNVGIEIKRGSNNKLYLIEINPRIQGTVIIGAACGINFPYYELKMHLKEELPIIIPKSNIEVIRYWEDSIMTK